MQTIKVQEQIQEDIITYPAGKIKPKDYKIIIDLFQIVIDNEKILLAKSK